MLLVFAGPNGSGKSTITQYFEKVRTYTNADEIVATTGMSSEEQLGAAAYYPGMGAFNVKKYSSWTFLP